MLTFTDYYKYILDILKSVPDVYKCTDMDHLEFGISLGYLEVEEVDEINIRLQRINKNNIVTILTYQEFLIEPRNKKIDEFLS